MLNPLQQLQQLRANVKKMPEEDKRVYHDARKELEAVLAEYGQLAELALIEVALAKSVKRGE